MFFIVLVLESILIDESFFTMSVAVTRAAAGTLVPVGYQGNKLPG